jgi:hypothetical protein
MFLGIALLKFGFKSKKKLDKTLLYKINYLYV